ncbi:glycosyltransferase [Vibrio cyclitrophicus]
MRTSTVQLLKNLGWNVVVVMPSSENVVRFIEEEGILRIPLRGNQRLAAIFQRIGYQEDYLDKWVEDAYSYLQGTVKPSDIVFSTSGGELGTIKLGAILKRKIGCKFVVNYRDPTDYTLVHGLKKDNRFHVSRESNEKKYLSCSDLVLTSSKSNLVNLSTKYQDLNIINNYFGYVKETDVKCNKRKRNKIRIAYAGSMLKKVQDPSYLIDIFTLMSQRENFEVYFIGDTSKNKELVNKSKMFENVYFLDHMSHPEYLDFMMNNIDIGFLSLSKDYYGACVPSKLYEYINLIKPMVAILPEGDAKDIINSNHYGLALGSCDLEKAAKYLDSLFDGNELYVCESNIRKDKHLWSMNHLIKDVDTLLKNL